MKPALNKTFRIAFLLFNGFISIIIIFFILRLFDYSGASSHNSSEHLNSQLKWISHELKNERMPEKMQELFPEGWFFSHVLYGLTQIERINAGTSESEALIAMHEAMRALSYLESDAGKAPFARNQAIEYGAFYAGWTNYLRGKIVLKGDGVPFNIIEDFRRESLKLAEVMDSLITPYPESYVGQAWPVDAVVAVASLALYNQAMPKEAMPDVIQRWLKKVKEHPDPETGLIPHEVSPETGDVLDGARGSSLTMMLRFLSDIDPVFAADQFQKYKSQFLIYRLGRPAISEYPHGRQGTGDVDSGPVIFRMGFSATIIAPGTFRIFGEQACGNSIDASIEAFGFPSRMGNGKHYIWGALPIADAFIAWSRVKQSPNNEIVSLKGSNNIPVNGQYTWFLILGTGLLILTWFPTWRRFRKKKKQKSSE